MFNDHDRLFAQQFRFEEDRWVFRYQQGGLPVVVTARERDRLVAEHRRRTTLAKRSAFGAFVALSLLLSPMIAIGVPRGIMLAALLVVPIAVRIGLGHWSDKALTRPLRARQVVGERLGLVGRFKMRAETSSWRDLWLQAGLVGLYVVGMPFQHSVAMILLVAVGVLLVASRILVKWTAEQRGLRGSRWSRLSRRAHRLADKGDDGGR